MLIDLRTGRRPGMGAGFSTTRQGNLTSPSATAKTAAAAGPSPLPDNTLLSAVVAAPKRAAPSIMSTVTAQRSLLSSGILSPLLSTQVSAFKLPTSTAGSGMATSTATKTSTGPLPTITSAAPTTTAPAGQTATPLNMAFQPTPTVFTLPTQPSTPAPTPTSSPLAVPDQILPPGTGSAPPPWWSAPPSWWTGPQQPGTQPGGGSGGGGGGGLPGLDSGSADQGAPAEATILGFPAKTVLLAGAAAAAAYFLFFRKKGGVAA